MAAPTFVRKTQHQASGASPVTVAYGATVASGDLITLEVWCRSDTATVTTPTGYTKLLGPLDVSLTGGAGRVYIFYKVAAGTETNVAITFSDDSDDREIIFAQHSGLTSPAPYAAYVYRRANPAPGYGIIPEISYPSGPAAVLTWLARRSGYLPGPTVLGTGLTLRTPITTEPSHVSLGDMLRDSTAGTTPLYPAAGGWRFNGTDVLSLITIGVAFIDGLVGLSADFVASVTSGTAPLAVDFTDTTTGLPDVWAWDFGDGGTSTSQNPSHTYLMPGTYTVTLTATRTSDDAEDSESKTFFVIVGEAGVFIDWEVDGFENGDDDNISSAGNVMSWVINRGASAEVTGGSTPGSATLTLKNPSDIYNPRNASSPLDGFLRDGAPVWIGPNADGKLTGDDPRGLFGGRITDITLIPAGGAAESPMVEIACEDMLGWAQRTPVLVDYQEGRSHDALRVDALETAGETRYDLDNEIHTMPLSNASGNLAQVLDDINRINGTRHLAKPADVYTDWFRYTTYNRHRHLDGVADASLNAGSDHVTGTSGWRLSADSVTNRQRATVVPIVFTPGTFTVWQHDRLPFRITDRRPYTRTIEFDDVVRDPHLDIAYTGDPVTSTLTPFATGAKLRAIVGVGNTATVTALDIEGRLARRFPAESYEANDEDSQDAPRGIREGSEIGNEYLGVLASAEGIARHVVWRYGNPQLRPTLTVENWLPEQFELDLYDVISFTSAQLDMTDVLFEIVGLTHEGRMAADAAVHHVTTYVLQECRIQEATDWFTLDSSLLDESDPLHY